MTWDPQPSLERVELLTPLATHAADCELAHLDRRGRRFQRVDLDGLAHIVAPLLISVRERREAGAAVRRLTSRGTGE